LDGWKRLRVVRRLRRVIAFVNTALIFASDFGRAATANLTGRRQAARRRHATTDLVFKSGAVLLASNLLHRSGFTLPLSAALHSRRGTIFALTSSGLRSRDSRRRRGSSAGNASTAGALNRLHRYTRAVMILLVGVGGSGRRGAFLADGPDFGRRCEGTVIRRHRASRVGSAARAARDPWSSARRQRAAGGRTEASPARSTIMGGRRWVLELGKSMPWRVNTRPNEAGFW
jgi:hypothetical protein